jgi:hypothetical protein
VRVTSAATMENVRYLRAKQQKLGHLLDVEPPLEEVAP